MRLIEALTLEMFIRVRQFGLKYASHFAADSAGAELLNALDGAIQKMEGHSAQQAQHKRAARQQTRQKSLHRRALLAAMKAISHTARAMSRSMPGLQDKFRMPEDKREQSLLATARSFAADAEPLKDAFIKHGMAPTFYEDFKTLISAVEQSVDGRAQKAAARLSSTVGIGKSAEAGRNAVRDLDPVVRNLFAADPAALAEWESASRVERAPRHLKQETPDPQPNPAEA